MIEGELDPTLSCCVTTIKHRRKYHDKFPLKKTASCKVTREIYSFYSSMISYSMSVYYVN